MTNDDALAARLRAHPPRDLGGVRALAHQATQLAARAARANLAPAPDDSHSSLRWDAIGKRFLSQPSPTGVEVGVGLAPLSLVVLKDGAWADETALAGRSTEAAADWLDRALEAAGLRPASSVQTPYHLPAEVEAIGVFSPPVDASLLDTFCAWYDLAQSLLDGFVAAKADVGDGVGGTLGPSPVRCWPHHFDIATYVVLEDGDPETARGVGVGLSPGDDTYDQPYFYVNPWPHLAADGLPPLPPPGDWHVQGFVGAVATADAVLTLRDVEGGMSTFLSNAFEAGRQRLGA